MSIEYKINEPITTDQFVALLKASTLGERRPIEDRVCMEGMISNSNLTVSAWCDGQLIGIARSVTDFYYACYLSDLAVSVEHQKSGIGKQLQILTQEQLGPKCKLILIAAPAANEYYKHIGFNNNPRCWVLDRESSIMSNETLSAEELGNKLPQSIKEMKAGKVARVSRVEPNEVAEASRKTSLPLRDLGLRG